MPWNVWCAANKQVAAIADALGIRIVEQFHRYVPSLFRRIAGMLLPSAEYRRHMKSLPAC